MVFFIIGYLIVAIGFSIASYSVYRDESAAGLFADFIIGVFWPCILVAFVILKIR
jgi:hypothetical protein